jgi:phage major head subunit gpT-like protein
MEVNKANLANLTRGFQSIFQGAFDSAPSQYDQIAMTVNSTTDTEDYGWLGTSTAFREWLGDRVLQGLKDWNYAIKNKDYENTITVGRNTIMDDKYGLFTPMIQQLGMDTKDHPNLLTFALFQQGFSTNCFDGQYFFDVDHPVVDANGVTQSVSNFGGGAGTAWYLIDDTRALKPMIFQKRQDYKFVAMDKDDDEELFNRKQFRYGVDARCNVGFGLWQLAYASKQTLDVNSYVAARAAMSSLKKDGGSPLNIRPKMLLVPPTLEKAALDVVKATQLANGATNVMAETAKVVMCPWLS